MSKYIEDLMEREKHNQTVEKPQAKHFFEKCQAEITAEAGAMFQNQKLTSLNIGCTKPKAICPYYFVDDTGKRFELAQLNENQIINFCAQSIEAYAMLNNNQDSNNAVQLKQQVMREANGFITAVHYYCNFTPSWNAMKTIVNYTNAESSTVRSVAKNLFGVVADDKLRETEIIARFMQEAKGNYERPTAEQMCQVINQKIINERQKNNNVERTW